MEHADGQRSGPMLLDRLSDWENVMKEHLFSGDEHADALGIRMYAGFLHPIIYLGFGVDYH